MPASIMLSPLISRAKQRPERASLPSIRTSPIILSWAKIGCPAATSPIIGMGTISETSSSGSRIMASPRALRGSLLKYPFRTSWFTCPCALACEMPRISASSFIVGGNPRWFVKRRIAFNVLSWLSVISLTGGRPLLLCFISMPQCSWGFKISRNYFGRSAG